MSDSRDPRSSGFFGLRGKPRAWAGRYLSVARGQGEQSHERCISGIRWWIASTESGTRQSSIPATLATGQSSSSPSTPEEKRVGDTNRIPNWWDGSDSVVPTEPLWSHCACSRDAPRSTELRLMALATAPSDFSSWAGGRPPLPGTRRSRSRGECSVLAVMALIVLIGGGALVYSLVPRLRELY